MRPGLLGVSWTLKGPLAWNPSKIIKPQEMLILDSDHRTGVGAEKEIKGWRGFSALWWSSIGTLTMGMI